MEVTEKFIFTEIQNWKNEDCDVFCFYWINYEKRGERESEGHLCFRITQINNILRITGNLTDKVTGHIIWVLQLEKGFFVCSKQGNACLHDIAGYKV